MCLYVHEAFFSAISKLLIYCVTLAFLTWYTDHWTHFQDGVTSEIIALAQGFMDIADLMGKVKGVSHYAHFDSLRHTSETLSGWSVFVRIFVYVCVCLSVYLLANFS